MALHLRMSVQSVRVLMVLLGLAGGAGVLLYLFWWATVPAGDPRVAAEANLDPLLRRIAPRLNLPAVVSALPRRDVAIGASLLSVAAVGVAIRLGWDWRQTWVVPAGLALGGLALAWSQLDAVGREGAGDGPRRPAVLRLIGGVVLVALGLLLLLGHGGGRWALLQATSAAAAVLVGFLLVLAPWWLRMVRALGDQRAATAREAERADIAAHLHDSVLQTLAMIRAQAADPDAVARLARSQERELREWLYTDRRATGTSLVAEMRELVGEVEDGKVGKGAYLPAVTVDLVAVGDCGPTADTEALLQATREALVNAVSHGRGPVSVYLEVTDAQVQAFVRDRGDGFDPAQIPVDRLGVRESILGRMRRRGGVAEVVSRPGWGTEVRLTMPRQPTRAEPGGVGEPAAVPALVETSVG